MCKNPLAVVDRGLSHDILVIVSFTSLSWGTPIKGHEIAPYLRLPVDFLHTNQCNVDKLLRVSAARHSGFAMRIGLK